MDIRKMLVDFYSIIEEVDVNLCETSKTNALIFENLSNLKTTSKNFELIDSVCNYKLVSLKIKLPYKPAKCRPENIEKIEIILDITNEIHLQENENIISDPVKKLKLDILLKGDEHNICTWHLDKHSELTKDGDGDNKYIHPEYHFSYGGKKMEDTISDYGNTLLIRSPRLMHPPLDVILGIDFVINQFIPKTYAQPFIKNPVYNKIVTEMKKLIWKPYTLALVNNFHTNWIDDLKFEGKYSQILIG